jgi:predicted HTH domain antitoxin
MAVHGVEGFQVMLPNTFLPVLQHLSKGESMDDVVRQSLSISLYVERAVTMERAAELSGLSLVDFIALLEKREIPWGEYTEEHFGQDRDFIEKRAAAGDKGLI